MSIKSRSKLKEQEEHPKNKHKKPVCRYNFFDISIPEGFILVIDSNELASNHYPLFREPQKGLEIVKGNLKDGDYSILGMEDKVTVERKRLGDFVSYITSEYKEKTLNKLERMSKMYRAFLVIEENEKELYEPKIFSSITNEQIINHLASINCHYGIFTYMDSDRKWLELYILHRLVRCYEYLRK